MDGGGSRDDGDSKQRRTLPSDDWSEEVTSVEGGDVAEVDDDSNTTFSYSSELSSKKPILRLNHWSDDITSGYCCETTRHPRPLGNTHSDDTCREGTKDRAKST